MEQENPCYFAMASLTAEAAAVEFTGNFLVVEVCSLCRFLVTFCLNTRGDFDRNYIIVHALRACLFQAWAKASKGLGVRLSV